MTQTEKMAYRARRYYNQLADTQLGKDLNKYNLYLELAEKSFNDIINGYSIWLMEEMNEEPQKEVI